MKTALKKLFEYVIELTLAYVAFFVILYFLDRERAEFFAGLALFFTMIACAISRPPAPHVLIRYAFRPWVGLVFLVNVVFGIFNASHPDYGSLVPGAALMLILGSFGECLRRSKERKSGSA